MSKVSVYIARAATVIVDGVEHKLQAGRQVIEKAVAEHWMVKHLTADAPALDVDNQVADLVDQNVALKAQLEAVGAANAELGSQVEALKADAAKQRDTGANVITTLTENATANAAKIATLEGQATADAAKIAELEAQVAEFLATPAGAKKAK